MAASKAIADILKTYSKVFPNSGLDAEGVGIYVRKLERFEEEQIVQAMDSLVEKCRFFPTIAEIIEAINTQPKKIIYYGSPEWQEQEKKRLRELEESARRAEQREASECGGRKVPAFLRNAETRPDIRGTRQAKA